MIETVIASSALIVGVCLLRFLLKGRISPQIQYGMWILVAVRLIFPWLSPLFGEIGHISSRFSVMNAAERIRENVAVRGYGISTADPYLAGQAAPYAPSLPITDANSAAAAAATPLQGWETALLCLWLVGAIVLLVGMLVLNLRFSRRLYLNRRHYDGETYGVTSLPVYCVEGLSSPCFLSYLGDKAIYLPDHMAREGVDVRHVLIHEDCHARHHDHLWGLVRCVLLGCYWINPLVWAAAFLSKRDCELACDDAAIRRLGEDERFDYGRTLLKLASGSRDFSQFFCASSEMNNGKKAIKERVVILAKHPRTTKVMAVLLILAVAGLVLFTYTGKGAKTDSTEDLTEDSTENSTEDLTGDVTEGLTARAEAWAEAFCGRDGNTLYSMYHPDHQKDFYGISQVMSEPEDEHISFGWSSPWPMSGEYTIKTDGTQSTITYTALTSEPHRWVWKEWLNWESSEGEWLVTEEISVEYDQIHTAEEFQQAYGEQIAGTPMDYGDVAENLDRLAQEEWGEVFTDPALAMEYLLNLQGGIGTVVNQDDSTTVVYTFPDKSQAAVAMERSVREGGAWRPVEIVPVPKGSGEERTPVSVSVEDVVKFAGVKDAEQVSALLETLGMRPSKSQSAGFQESEVLNRIETYQLSLNGEAYELQISYWVEDESLFYITLVRLSTGERLNIYEIPETMEKYKMTPVGENEIRTFINTHANMDDYLTYRRSSPRADTRSGRAIGDAIFC